MHPSPDATEVSDKRRGDDCDAMQFGDWAMRAAFALHPTAAVLQRNITKLAQ